MIYAYMGRNRKLCLRPADPEGEEELQEFLQQYKQLGLEAIDIETDMPEEQYQNYKRQMSRYGYDKQGGQQGFGFQPNSYYMPQPPDFSPQAHFPLWPLVLPYILEGRRDGGEYGREGGGGSGGSQSGNIGLNDRITRSERGEYDGRGRGTENPRDTGRGDSPRR